MENLRTIYKQEILIGCFNATQTVLMQKDAKILDIQLQADHIRNEYVISIWFTCIPDSESVVRSFVLLATGDWMDGEYFEKLQYLKTIQHEGLVYHLFEKVI